MAQLRMVDLARPAMERMAATVGGECTAPAGQPDTRVGERIPFIPPVAQLFAAFATDEERQAWLGRMPSVSDEHRERLRIALVAARERGFAFGTHTQRRQDLFRALAQLRVDAPAAAERANIRAAVERLADGYDPDDLAGAHGVEYVGALIFDKNGRMALQLTVFGQPQSDAGTAGHVAMELREACDRATQELGGRLRRTG